MYLPPKFQVSSIILTSFIQGVVLILSHIFGNIFLMIWKDWSSCEQNLQYVAILHKRLKIFIFIFFKFNFSFFQNIFHCNIILGCGFPMISNLWKSFKSSKYQSFWNWFRLKEILLGKRNFLLSSVEFILDQSQHNEHSLDFLRLVQYGEHGSNHPLQNPSSFLFNRIPWILKNI